ncbi:SusC/RagA family TonB-linked outer membrane protein [Spirosoma telluris]|uniref:SusC/RagA family TonB-linked outer membrane protein n=1 Tax=Spirosoma telluris TaxID=2183553 RepID=UPI0018DD0319
MSRLRLPKMGLVLLGLLGQQLALAQSVVLARQQSKGSRVAQAAEGQKLKEVLTDLSRQHQVSILFEETTVQGITIPADSRLRSGKLEKQLQSLLKPYGLTAKKLNEQSYYIIKTPSKESVQPAAGQPEASLAPSAEGTLSTLSSMAITATAPPADIRVSGRVTGENGEGLPGVNVVMKGSIRGTNTDTEGRYQLSVPNTGTTLVFSFVGYASQEAQVGNRTTLDVQLVPDNKSLNEVVVVGYGTVKKSDLTGAVAKVGETNIKATPIPSLDRAMQGRAAGVQVVSNSAAPGGSSTIRIRGSGSVNASNDPLYVIDGFPTTGLNSINTNDIESIEVLKDASATAIYGSRGSNGVVLVTTKRGRSGKTVISYDAYYGVQTVRRKIPLLNARQFADFVNEARVNGGGQPYFDGSSADQPLPSSLGEGTDWQSQIFRAAPIQSHQLAASGGSDKSRYAISFGYYNQQGIILNSNFKRYTLRANLDNNLTSRLKAGLTMQGAFTTGNNAKTDVDGNGGGGVTSSALSYAPNFPIYNADGSYYKNTGALNGYGVDNPLAVANEITNVGTTIRLLANAYLDYTIIDGLNFRTSFGTDLQSVKTNSYQTRLSLAGASLAVVPR